MRKLTILLMVIIAASVVSAQQLPPTPDVFPTAQAFLESTPPVRTDGTGQLYDENGLPLLPDLRTNLTRAFGYAKYLMSASGAKGVFGPFANIVIHVRIGLTLALAWSAFYFAIVVVQFLIAIGLFIWRWILRIITAVGQIVDIFVPG